MNSNQLPVPILHDRGVFSFNGYPAPEELKEGLNAFILSASGWRKVFAADGKEESMTAAVSSADIVLTEAAAAAFARYITENRNREKSSGGTDLPAIDDLARFLVTGGKEEKAVSAGRRAASGIEGVVCLGCDTRPTGPVIIETLYRTLDAMGVTLCCPGTSAAPELMSSVAERPDSAGFIYVSASHNPAGHNGFKFGLSDGAVMESGRAARLIEIFRTLVDSMVKIAETGDAGPLRFFDYSDMSVTEPVVRNLRMEKETALKKYSDFTCAVITGYDSVSGKKKQDRVMAAIKRSCTACPLGIVADLNGSARTVSIDRTFLESLGIGTRIINNEPGRIAHRIVPEGRSLDPCCRELEEMHRKDPSFLFGYVPDNDGDRGNIVYIDSASGGAFPLEAQEVFALSVAAELSYIAWSGQVPVDAGGLFTEPVAVAVNGPTSMRVDRIAELFGARVFRAEVGEASVVQLARDLRQQGYTVRILGEGSNGGNITHPSAVRDPLSTVGALIKLLRLGGLAELWMRQCGAVIPSPGAVTVSTLLETLPRYITTSAYEPEAIMTITTDDHGIVKSRYEELFLTEWEERRSGLEQRWGISGWEEINYEGPGEKRGMGPRYRSGSQTGGLKILFSDRSGRQKAYIWMRGSGTEPVFRVLCDIEGDNREFHDYLLEWHRGMIEKADGANGR